MAEETQQQTKEDYSKSSEENLQQTTEDRSLVRRIERALVHGIPRGLVKGVAAGTLFGGAVLGVGYALETTADTFFYVTTGASSLGLGVVTFLYESQKSQAKEIRARLQKAERAKGFREYVTKVYKNKLEEKIV